MMVSRFLACLLFTGLCLGFLAAPATAQRKPIKTPYSETEKVGFAFYKLADQSPPLEQWLKSSDEYRLASPSLKRDYLRREIQRLAQAFSEYDLKRDLIYIRAPVRIKIPSTSEQAAYDKMGVRKPAEIVIDDIKDNYFPVEVGNMWIAIVANDLDNITLLSLDDEEFKKIHNLSASGQGTYRRAFMELRLLPQSVDLQKPLSLDNLDAWLMLAEIASITLWKTDDSKQVVWEQRADWYRPQQEQEMLDLYRR